MAHLKALVIAGGGGGGCVGNGGGGGGAGGYLEEASHSVTAQAYTITVGAGGGGSTNGVDGGTGGNSIFDTMTALGGGGGEGHGDGGGNGGSGGGAQPNSSSHGTGTSGQGKDGGNGTSGAAGGGGGASTAGSNAVLSTGGTGGTGTASTITGSSVTYAGGGGGGGGGAGGTGGSGGGGAGGVINGTAGTANTGGGGGGGGAAGQGFNGGTGVVIFSYVTANFGSCTGGTITTDGANTVHTFTSSGTFTVVGLPLPTVTTQAVSSITSTTAVGNGNITVTGGINNDERGVVFSLTTHSDPGNVAPSASSYSGQAYETGSFGTGAFTETMTGLTGGAVTYYVRAYSHNDWGYSYGSEVSFATAAIAPTVTTQPVSGIGGTSATGNGTVVSDGGATITERGVVWGTSANPTTADSKATAAGTTGVYTASITGLANSVIYHVRAYAINSVGTSYGIDTRFNLGSGNAGFLEGSIFVYGQYDVETTRGLFRLLRKAAIGSETDVIQMPVCLTVSNLFYGSSSAGYTNNQVGSAKVYFSTLETSSSPTTKYRFYQFTTVPTGTGTTIGGVYETQQETSVKLFKGVLKKKLKVYEVRVYTAPLIAGNSFQIDLIGNDNSPVDGGTYVFTVGTNLTAGTDFAMYNPEHAPQHSIGLRITNLGPTNWECEKVELDMDEAGK